MSDRNEDLLDQLRNLIDDLIENAAPEMTERITLAIEAMSMMDVGAQAMADAGNAPVSVVIRLHSFEPLVPNYILERTFMPRDRMAN